MENTGYHKLIIYQKSKDLVLFTYKLTKGYPNSEVYGMVSQMRRAVVSIPANIVEGYTKSSTKDFARFLDISLGSLAELQVYFELSFELEYINEESYTHFNLAAEELNKIIRTFRRSILKNVN